MAKIVFTADLHLGITASKTIRRMIEAIGATEPDAVVVAGDLGEPLHVFEHCLDLLHPLRCPIGILAGNHDIWTHPNDDYDSAELFFHRLPHAVQSREMTWLETEEMRLSGGVTVVGTIGWYDYSNRSARTANWTDAQLAAAKPSLNNDGNYITWSFTDPEFAAKMLAHLERRLVEAVDDSSVSQIVVATHVPVFAEQLVHRESDDDVADAYFANLTLGRMIAGHPKISAVVSGHTHRPVAFGPISRGQSYPLTVATIGSEYLSPTFVTLEL